MKYHYLLYFILMLSACHRTQPIPDVTSGLMVDITFTGNSTELISGNQGNTHNAALTTDRFGNGNNAMLFTAADSSFIDYGDLPMASFDSTNKFTISCWVRVGDTSKPGAVLSKRGLGGPFEYCLDNHFDRNGFTLDNWNAGGGASVYGIDPLKAKAAIMPGQWQHIAYVADGNALHVYLNGVLQSGLDQQMGYIFSNTDAPFVVGNGGGFGRNYYFDGAIDDIKIYNHALNQEAISYLAN